MGASRSVTEHIGDVTTTMAPIPTHGFSSSSVPFCGVLRNDNVLPDRTYQQQDLEDLSACRRRDCAPFA